MVWEDVPREYRIRKEGLRVPICSTLKLMKGVEGITTRLGSLTSRHCLGALAIANLVKL